MRNEMQGTVWSAECGVRSEKPLRIRCAEWSRSIACSCCHTPNSKGFTLIEVIVTLVVLSIAAVGVLSVFTAGIRGSADPIILNQAIALAQGEMDAVMSVKRRANGFTALGAGVGGCASTMLAGFTCSRNVYFVNPGALNTSVGGPTDYKHITVTITPPVVGDVVLDGLVTNY